ncbi:hypothetical protein KZZ52_22555 [Dactylosporangium sp. AC04546]|uniref:hypothetical protein n=1 Tax=Dactylosporangium sp. AC04546 TaxID=2862460 RepID=UPI001EDF145B|nr:hypothetical protein [Dactylosporangium sp. AC04546]WVK88062.1 hypothetical protein KZZ52_22555 [Dactylosporangium sp. AC04546]
MAGGEAAFTNRELNFVHPVHVIGLHIGILSRTELFPPLLDELRAAGVLTPGRPAVYDLAEVPGCSRRWRPAAPAASSRCAPDSSQAPRRFAGAGAQRPRPALGA